MLRVARLSLAALILLALALSLVPALPAAAEPRCTEVRPSYGDDPATVRFEHIASPVCVVRSATVTVPAAGSAIQVAGRLEMDDGGTALADEDSRYFWRAEIICVSSSGEKVFVTDAGRNLWDGIGRVSVEPRGVFIAPAPGIFSCELRATQRNIYHYAVGDRTALPDRTWAVSAAALSVVPPSRGGASSAGPNGVTFDWPHGRSDLTAADAGIVVSERELALDDQATIVHVVGSIQLSSCSFNSDVWAGACSARESGPFSATVRIFARQRTSADDGTFCGGQGNRLVVDLPVVIDATTHHTVASASGSFVRDPACTGTVVIRTELWDITGRGYLGTGQGQGQPLIAYSTAVGAAWN